MAFSIPGAVAHEVGSLPSVRRTIAASIKSRIGWSPSRPLREPSRDPVRTARILLSERGHALVGEPRPPQHVNAWLNRSAVIGELRFPERSYRVVVKSTATNMGVRSAPELARVLTALADSSTELADALPAILGADPAEQLAVFGYVEGDCLDTRLEAALRSGDAADACNTYLRAAGVLMARVHELPAHQFMADEAVRCNESFTVSLNEVLSPFSSELTKAGLSTSRLLERLRPAFMKREADRMFLIDARAENLVVKPTGDLSFIDLDCSCGSPGIGVAVFLVALDRLGSRFPGRDHQALLSRWKKHFLRGYAKHADSSIGEDVTFFYPWMLGNMFDQHRHHRPMFRPYLRWYYGRRLERFLTALSSFSPDHVSAMPELLFSV